MMIKRAAAMLLIFALTMAGSCAYAASIRLGSTGNDVSQLQTMLKELGYYTGNITGHAGEKTVEAIRKFQEKHGLEQDGVAGPATMKRIQAIADPDGAPSSASETSGSDVKKAQTMLKALGLYYGEITGNIGTKTEAAIKKFQKENDLTADGVPGKATLAKLEEAYEREQKASDREEEKEAEKETEKDKAEDAGAAFVSLRVGSTGDDVLTIQENLKALGYYYGDLTAHYGTKTQAAVRLFQRANGLTADGIAGKKTFAAVEEAAEEKEKEAEKAEKEEKEEKQETGGKVLDLHWFDEKSFYNSHGVKKGATLTVVDVVSGKMFNVRVQSTGSHADVEPKTAKDTQIMCEIYGVDSAEEIDWKRRAILVKANMGGGTIYTYAASMYGEVHGSQTIYDNDYDGQFCIHFRHSTTSETKIEYADNQEPIDKAVSYAVSKLGMTHVTDPDQL